MNKDLNLLCMSCFSALPNASAACPVCGYIEGVSAQSPHHLPIRTILAGKYLIGRVLGEGGFGITYVGYDLNLDIKVAVKEYFPSGFATRTSTVSETVSAHTGDTDGIFVAGRERFVGEAKRLAHFRTLPGIVMVNDFFAENGTAYIVMEYVEGQTLKEYLAQQGGTLPAEQVVNMLAPVFASLAQVHGSGIIHRDISPDNIMITSDGTVKLLDFGAAREFSESGNKSLSVLLKHGYAPAEQYTSRGVQGPHTDVYALAATIYKAITGITPESSMDRVFEDIVVPPSGLGVEISPQQEVALMKALAVRSEDRFQTVSDFYNALTGAVPDAPSDVGANFVRPLTEHTQPAVYTDVNSTPVGDGAQSVADGELRVPQNVETPPQYPESPHGIATSPAKPRQSASLRSRAHNDANDAKPKSKRNSAIIAAAISACVVVGAIIGINLRSSDNGDKPEARYDAGYDSALISGSISLQPETLSLSNRDINISGDELYSELPIISMSPSGTKYLSVGGIDDFITVVDLEKQIVHRIIPDRNIPNDSWLLEMNLTGAIEDTAVAWSRNEDYIAISFFRSIFGGAYLLDRGTILVDIGSETVSFVISPPDVRGAKALIEEGVDYPGVSYRAVFDPNADVLYYETFGSTNRNDGWISPVFKYDLNSGESTLISEHYGFTPNVNTSLWFYNNTIISDFMGSSKGFIFRSTEPSASDEFVYMAYYYSIKILDLSGNTVLYNDNRLMGNMYVAEYLPSFSISSIDEFGTASANRAFLIDRDANPDEMLLWFERVHYEEEDISRFHNQLSDYGYDNLSGDLWCPYNAALSPNGEYVIIAATPRFGTPTEKAVFIYNTTTGICGEVDISALDLDNGLTSGFFASLGVAGRDTRGLLWLDDDMILIDIEGTYRLFSLSY